MADLIGRTLSGRYRVDEFVGKGGMADVYKVWDKKRAVFLAMKILHDDLAEDLVFIRRFSREAETLSTLQHPHIVRFYGLEQDGDLTFILMDFVNGMSLRKEIYNLRKPFMPERVLQIMQPVCSALHYAHEMGRVHCDIKPANIMLRANGDVLVADFGIARMMEGATTMTMVGAGTPAYMAPEQIRGKRPIPQTDIYSLGILLFEMFTGGDRPFVGDHAHIEGSTSEKVRWEQVNLEPPSIRTYNPSLPKGMDELIARCLEKSPERRHPNASALLSELAFILRGEPERIITNKPPQPVAPKKPQSPPKEQRVPRKTQVVWPFLIFGLVALLILIGGIFTSVWNGATGKGSIANLPSTLAESSSTFHTATMVPPIEVWISPKDGMEMILVPAGEFIMGSEDGSSDEKPSHVVYLDDFSIDRTEVTNSMYAKCVESGNCSAPGSDSSYSRENYFRNPDYANYPVINVSWENANDYCEWAERRMPTEAEWEKAASWDLGQQQKRKYPWGNDEPKAGLSNFGKTIGETTRVGAYPSGASYYGALDMAGNIWEWVADWYGESYYKESPLSNPQGPSTGQYHLLRGGSWYNASYYVRTTARNKITPNQTNFYLIGFRCAHSE